MCGERLGVPDNGQPSRWCRSVEGPVSLLTAYGSIEANNIKTSLTRRKKKERKEESSVKIREEKKDEVQRHGWRGRGLGKKREG